MYKDNRTNEGTIEKWALPYYYDEGLRNLLALFSLIYTGRSIYRLILDKAYIKMWIIYRKKARKKKPFCSRKIGLRNAEEIEWVGKSYNGITVWWLMEWLASDFDGGKWIRKERVKLIERKKKSTKIFKVFFFFLIFIFKKKTNPNFYFDFNKYIFVCGTL